MAKKIVTCFLPCCWLKKTTTKKHIFNPASYWPQVAKGRRCSYVSYLNKSTTNVYEKKIEVYWEFWILLTLPWSQKDNNADKHQFKIWTHKYHFLLCDEKQWKRNPVPVAQNLIEGRACASRSLKTQEPKRKTRWCGGWCCDRLWTRTRVVCWREPGEISAVVEWAQIGFRLSRFLCQDLGWTLSGDCE